MNKDECVSVISGLIGELDVIDDRVDIAVIKLKFDMLKWLHAHQPDAPLEAESTLERFLDT